MALEQTQAQVPKVQHIWCSVTISKKMEDVFTGFINGQAQVGTNISEYVVYLATLGGSPFSAISLYNFVKAIPQKTTVYNMGNVSSAGVPFFLSFQTRIGVPDCSFMVHQTTLARTALPDNFNVFDLDTTKANLSATDDNTQKIILKETTPRASKPLTAAIIRKAFLKSTTYHAAEAQAHGFIDKIELPKLPDTGLIYITDQYLATLPG
ncbi:MAG: ATP-dependent Clp protease proteolytic subunit [Candidatus Aminicenantales bacterium]|jgi:ATP-dependent protease ClpP protease subunit